ncbi:hypothetical protein [Methanosarcina mazei]|uniref:hypothetical protein n=1 Tax=Methanosarcina mazei TaxID=2209 RepID=UPI0012D4A0FA|nr:hypothetical protein [Methanosarcina mazei]
MVKSMVEVFVSLKYNIFKRKTEPVLKAGMGSCTKCACSGFQPDYDNKNVCANCGHNYFDHY